MPTRPNAEVVRRATGRGLRVLTVGAEGRTLKLLSSQREGFGQQLLIEGPTAGSPCSCRWSAVSRPRTHSLPRASPSRPAASEAMALRALERLKGATGRLELVGDAPGRRARVRRLRAQARRARARRCEALRPLRAGRLVVRVRLRRRPRPRQAAADGRDRGASWPTSSSSPTTTRAARTPRPSAPRSWPARPARIEIGDRGEAIRARRRRPAGGRRAARRRQGPRDGPDRRRPGAAVLRSRGCRARRSRREASVA